MPLCSAETHWIRQLLRRAGPNAHGTWKPDADGIRQPDLCRLTRQGIGIRCKRHASVEHGSAGRFSPRGMRRPGAHGQWAATDSTSPKGTKARRRQICRWDRFPKAAIVKFRNRELNIFSMSALDLFASALGAFILISIVLMPYFLRPPITPIKARFPKLDLVMALDTTGSMHKQVGGLRSEIVQLTQILHKLSPSLAVGVIDFKDRCEGRNAVRVFALRHMSPAALNALVSFTRTMRAGGTCNRDRPEALAAALDKAIASNWRPESNSKAIVIITDAPAYPERQAHALNAARAFASRSQGHKVSVVLRADHVPFLGRLARAGRGDYVRVGGSFATTILSTLIR